MNRIAKKLTLALFCTAAVFIVGCFPESLILWSDDGSTGVLSANGALAMVDGQTGELTMIRSVDDEEAAIFNVDISADGSLIAYIVAEKCPTLAEGLEQLTSTQFTLLDHYAQQVREQLLAGQTDFSKMDLGPFAPDMYRSWLEWYVQENPGEALKKKFGDDIPDDEHEVIGVYKLFVATPDQIANGEPGRLITTSLWMIAWPKISPDGKLIAYTLYNQLQEGEEFLRFDLYVAEMSAAVKGMHVADFVTPRCGWRDDSRALVFTENALKDVTDRYSIGTLRLVEVADTQGKLLAEAIEGPSLGTHRNKGEAKDLAGIIFHPFMKVEYGPAGRVFFSSYGMSLPASTIKSDLIWSLFCYDTMTGSVSDVLPPDISERLTGCNAMGYFALSPDGLKTVLPMEKHRFLIYELGQETTHDPIPESEAFGDSQGDSWVIMPSWKGNDQITCLVSGKSSWLEQPEEVDEDHREMVIIKSDGEFIKVLSTTWPDELLKK